MFESLLGDLFSSSGTWDKVSDFFTGYTSAKQANRFANQNMSIQQQYNRENMALEDSYQRALMRDAASIQVAGLRAAGLNPLLAVGDGIKSPNSAASASLPSASAPSVNPQLGNVFGMATSAISAVPDFMRIANESKVADAQVQSLQADAKLKAAQALNQPSIKGNIDTDTTTKKAHAITEGLGVAAPIVSSAAGAYAAKRSADVAIKAMAHGVTKESAVKIAKDIVGKSPATSAYSAASVLGVLGSRILPTLGLGFGTGALMKKAQDNARKEGRTSFTHHMSAGW